MSYLVDTNVISELRKREKAGPAVQAWFASVADEEIFLSVLTVGEIRQGIERIRRRDLAAATALDRWLDRVVDMHPQGFTNDQVTGASRLAQRFQFQDAAFDPDFAFFHHRRSYQCSRFLREAGLDKLRDPFRVVAAGQADLLHHRVVPQVVAHAIAHSLALGKSDKFFTFFNCGGQRLFADHVLPCLQRFLRHHKMLDVGRANVDCINRRIAQEIVIIRRNCGK